LNFFTFYDHLEEFLSLGVLLDSDKLVIPSTQQGASIGENKAVINEATQIESLDDSLSVNLSPAPGNKLSK
jgi:hypothetical protein